MTSGSKKRVVIGLSGGRDSGVAAALLKNQGYDVLGLFIDYQGNRKALEGFAASCRAITGPEAASEVASRLSIPLQVVSARELFEERVLDHFVHSYLQQRLPDSCARCHLVVRMPTLFETAARLGAAFVSTGHYARVMEDPAGGLFRLYSASDQARDQSHLLYGLSQELLRRLLLPLDGLSGAMVDRLADELGLPAGPLPSGPRSAESRGDCYAGRPGYEEFIEDRVAPSLRPRGVIRSVHGDVVGEHWGLHRYSLGQKRGFQLHLANPEPMVVTGFDPDKQALLVGPESALSIRKLMLANVTWLRPMDGLHGLKCRIRIDGAPLAELPACRVTQFENQAALVELDQAVRATPGQTAVFYDADELLGGGTVDRLETPS